MYQLSKLVQANVKLHYCQSRRVRFHLWTNDLVRLSQDFITYHLIIMLLGALADKLICQASCGLQVSSLAISLQKKNGPVKLIVISSCISLASW